MFDEATGVYEFEEGGFGCEVVFATVLFAGAGGAGCVGDAEAEAVGVFG